MFDQMCLPQNRTALIPTKAVFGRLVPLLALTFLFSSLMSACAVPAMVEGIVHGEDFKIIDLNPAARFDQRQEQIVVTIAEQDADTLRLVTLKLDDASDVAAGDVFEIETDDKECFSVDVSTGDLETLTLGNGNTVISASNNVFSHALSGTLVVDSFDEEFAGTLDVELDDGGHLQGVFVMER
ncbi:MAG: hypothetical protein GY822_23865 [Deltaproteobacteria bacterium]|nr:hypothetical protein [Deltaproteobacteria bacterium]